MQDGPIDWNEDAARAVISKLEGERGALLLVLQALQERFGHVPDAAVALIAEALNLSRAEVHGVRTFYHDFHDTRRGRHVLKICRAEACQSMGGEKLAERTARALGVQFGETTPDGSVTLEAVYCLGLCACAPSALFDDRPVGRLNDKTIKSLLAEAQA
jgi:formate dehydrogenase subunit gamma